MFARSRSLLIHARQYLSLLPLLFFALCAPTPAADYITAKAGGVLLQLPAPSTDFAAAGERLTTTFFEVLVPANLRLLAAYVPTERLAQMEAGHISGMPVYALLEVPRQAEYTDCTPEAFQQVLKSMGPTMAAIDTNNLTNSVNGELSLRMRSLGAKPIEVGHTEMLGILFRKPEAVGVALAATFKQADRNVTMAVGMGTLRINRRLVFAYLYRKYEGPDTLTWLSRSLDAWSDALLADNK